MEDYREISDGWNDTSAVASANGKLYIVDSGTLYEVGVDGEHTELSDGWDDVAGMTAMNGKLYIVSRGSLYEIG